MTRRYFGTDGIRGLANRHPMTSEVALKVGMAAGKLFQNGKHRHRVVIGKDTRLSGYMLEAGAHVRLHGRRHGCISSRPDADAGRRHADALSARRPRRHDLGVAQSLRRQRHQAFDPDGYKLSDDMERDIERLIESPIRRACSPRPTASAAPRASTARRNAISNTPKRTLPKNLKLNGLRIVIDCANGAGYKVAPKPFWELGAEVIKIGVNPDGRNINYKCGSTAPEADRKRCARFAPISASRSTATRTVS